MTAIRLTKDTRKIIIDRALAHGFDKREKVLLDEEHALAAKVYDRAYPAKQQKVMESLPKGFFEESSEVYFYVSGEHRSLTLSKSCRQAESYDVRRPKFAGDDKLAMECIAFKRRQKALSEERDNARRQAWSVVDSVTSLAKLLQVWPEVEAFTQDIGGNGKPVTALAVPIKKLNVTLGLPPGTKS